MYEAEDLKAAYCVIDVKGSILVPRFSEFSLDGWIDKNLLPLSVLRIRLKRTLLQGD
jgi:hypothetical protein